MSFSPRPRALTLVAPVVSARRGALDAALAEIAADLEHNRLFPFASLPTTHFARFVILPPAAGEGAHAELVFESNYDGEPDDYLDHLARVAPAGLDATFGCCADWPGVADVAGYARFMRRCSRPAAAFHLGYRGHSKASVLNDLAVFAAVEDWLDAAEPRRAQLAGWPAVRLRERIARDVAATAPDLSLAPAGPDYRILLLVLVSPLALPILIAYLVLVPLVRPLERRDQPDDDTRVPVETLDAFAAHEDRSGWVQNQLTHLATLKPAKRRWLALRAALVTVDLLSRFYFNLGELGGITSIHFARWVILDDGRLLFLSNYDGSWESYLGEFVDRAHRGLTAVWSHTEGFPRTRRLTEDGASDEEAFKRWTRRRQLHTQVWYSSYQAFSIENIRNAIAVRQGLCARLGEEESRRWLARL
jgi:hypothetical protein